MLEIWGRTAGRRRCPRPCGGGREPQGEKRRSADYAPGLESRVRGNVQAQVRRGAVGNVPRGNALAAYSTQTQAYHIVPGRFNPAVIDGPCTGAGGVPEVTAPAGRKLRAGLAGTSHARRT